jgi:hypothetical protein
LKRLTPSSNSSHKFDVTKAIYQFAVIFV